VANKRNHEWPLASVVDGFFTQDKAGGVTQRVPLSLIVSSIQGQNVFQPLDGDLTAIAAISGTGILTRTGANTWAVVSTVAPSAHAASHLYGGGDALVGQSIPGLLPTNSPTWASVQLKGSGNSDLGFLSSAGSLRYIVRGDDTGDKWYVLTRNDDGSSRSERLRVPRSDASPVLVNLGLNVSSGALQLGGVDAITSAREGRFTGLRLTNLSAGQMPVCSDGNGQITASGETDDGTYFTSNRILRLWNTLTKTGDAWTAFQWTQDAQERVSMFSSNGSGAGAYPTLAMAHADAEATGRILGIQAWAQKVAGKSGTNPGVKVDVKAETVGAGGTNGGFGGKWTLRYRPDNGANLVDALRIGAFGGSTVDAVEAAILLRANANFLANYAKIQKDSDASVGLDVAGPSGTGKFRMVNTGGGSELGLPSGTLEIICANGIGIGTPGGASILVSIGDVTVANLWTSGSTKSQFLERTGSGATPDNETLIVYTGSANATESLPAATGSKRILEFSHSGTGDWTLDASGTDVLMDGGSSGVGSVTILPTNSTRSRRYIDYTAGKWARL
jgi:hypothetical protein